MSDEAEQSGARGGGRVRRRRRRWSEARKRLIVAESYEAGVSVSVVARRYDVNANQVFTWRRQYRELARAAGGFVPVVVASGGEGRSRRSLCRRRRISSHHALAVSRLPWRTARV